VLVEIQKADEIADFARQRAVGYLAGCFENPTKLTHFNDIAYLSYFDAFAKIILRTFTSMLQNNIGIADWERRLSSSLPAGRSVGQSKGSNS
jgi:hypothetical protein